jgi:hypothetical protein
VVRPVESAQAPADRHPAGTQRAPRVLFQLVPEAKAVKNRLHPEGNEFCVSQSASSRE